jgi:hypothetical protein
MSRRRFREHLPFVPKGEKYFRWRGREVSRLEGLADTVFAFAVTLLVVALEVPNTFAGLVEVVANFPAFAATFVFLLYFWSCHYRFFRRYALEDRWTQMLNGLILLLVLFSTYPLKFLFSGWFSSMGLGHVDLQIERWQIGPLFEIYGIGLAGIWGGFWALYRNAYRLREQLQLSPVEVILTRESLWQMVICVVVCLLSVALAAFSIGFRLGLPGFVYALIGPALTINGWWHGKQVRALEAAARPPPLITTQPEDITS